jgi:coenzyme F420 hydrogenase subunit beta
LNQTISAQDNLINNVLEKDQCSACGACVGLCPYFTFFQGRVVVLDRCSLTEGRCGAFCPQLNPGDWLKQEGLGPIQELWMTRAQTRSLQRKGQYGGTVTALIQLALELGWIQGALLTGIGKGGEPEGRICRTRAEVLACAGSKYTGAGTLSALKPALEANEGPLGAVGLPCQITALANIRSYPNREGRPLPEVKLKIGLFCTWSLPFNKMQNKIREQGIHDPVVKYDIPPPPSEEFQIFTRKKTYTLPLAEIRPLVPRGCLACGDMTAEGADISVGSAEGVPGWNTVLIRSEKGRQLFKEAQYKNLLDVKSLPEKNEVHLRTAAGLKKSRARALREEILA